MVFLLIIISTLLHFYLNDETNPILLLSFIIGSASLVACLDKEKLKNPIIVLLYTCYYTYYTLPLLSTQGISKTYNYDFDNIITIPTVTLSLIPYAIPFFLPKNKFHKNTDSIKIETITVACTLFLFITLVGYIGSYGYLQELRNETVSGTAFRTEITQNIKSGFGKYMTALRFVDLFGLTAGIAARNSSSKMKQALILVTAILIGFHLGGLTLGRLNTLFAMSTPLIGFYLFTGVKFNASILPFLLISLVFILTSATHIFRDSVDKKSSASIHRILSHDIGRINATSFIFHEQIRGDFNTFTKELSAISPHHKIRNSIDTKLGIVENKNTIEIFSSNFTSRSSSFIIPGLLGSLQILFGYTLGFVTFFFIIYVIHRISIMNNREPIIRIFIVILSLLFCRYILPHSTSNSSSMLVMSVVAAGVLTLAHLIVDGVKFQFNTSRHR